MIISCSGKKSEGFKVLSFTLSSLQKFHVHQFEEYWRWSRLFLSSFIFNQHHVKMKSRQELKQALCYSNKFFQGYQFILRNLTLTQSAHSLSMLQSYQPNQQLLGPDNISAEWPADVSSVGVEVDVRAAAVSLLCCAVRMRLRGPPKSHCCKYPLKYKHTKKLPLCCLSPAQSFSANRHCLCFPLLCAFRMIIVWHIQYVNIIIVSGRGPVIMEQEMTCQDP